MYGVESLMTDYVVLANDPIAKLPTAFTVCTSLFLQYMTTNQNFVEVYQADGSHWIGIKIEQLRNFEDFTERITMNFGGKNTNFWKSGLPIKPHSWYHACIGLDTESGHLRIVVNGYTVVDEVDPYFKNSQDKRPNI